MKSYWRDDGRADLKSMTLPELTEYLKDLGEKPFRAKQLYQWMHVELALLWMR